MYEHAASEDALVFLINESINGSPERRLAAKFLLGCLRNFQSPDEIAECIDDLEKDAILDIATDARQLAFGLGLLE
jgi:hypothetical protein